MSTRKHRRHWLHKITHRLSRAAERGCTFVTTAEVWFDPERLRLPCGTTARFYVAGVGPGGCAVRVPGGWVITGARAQPAEETAP